MWADTLLALERGHLQRLLLWAAASIVTGTALFAVVTLQRTTAPMLRHFAIQMAAWGAVNAAIAAWAWRGLGYRDFAGAQHLLNVLWLNIGLDAGYAAVGATCAVLGWRWGQRLGAVGAGVGIMLQGLVLALLDLRLVVLIGPVV